VIPKADLDLGDLRIRTLEFHDAELIVAATSRELAPAVWGPEPAGPYTRADAEAAMRVWDPGGEQISLGVMEESLLVAALGLMKDGPASAELAYWVRPEARGRGLAHRSVCAVTAWAHRVVKLQRIWLEISRLNSPSRRVAEGAGYTFEETRPDGYELWSHQSELGCAD
jgi:RimJ/RimL family protein N-acetyltransferase